MPARPPVIRHLTYANVTSTLALFLAAAGGTAMATSGQAAAHHRKSRPAPPITGAQIAAHTITSRNIRPHALTVGDFAAGSLPAGPAGVQGPQGPPGPEGPAGAKGSADAFAEVLTSGSQATYAVQQGFTGEPSHPITGVYCLDVPAGVSASTPLALSAVGREQDSGNRVLRIVEQTSPGRCSTTQFEVLTYGPDSTGNIIPMDQPFTVLVP